MIVPLVPRYPAADIVERIVNPSSDLSEKNKIGLDIFEQNSVRFESWEVN